jgi:2-oxoglutarate dehydrogenase E1 component
MGILLHSDSAFAEQGVVYEMMDMLELSIYSTSGTIHPIVINQSDSPPIHDSRGRRLTPPTVSSPSMPPSIFSKPSPLSAGSRIQKDVVIDIVFYHRYGHNVDDSWENDKPSFMQPTCRMFQAIQKQPTPLTQYQAFLRKRGTFTEKDLEERARWVWGSAREER